MPQPVWSCSSDQCWCCCIPIFKQAAAAAWQPDKTSKWGCSSTLPVKVTACNTAVSLPKAAPAARRVQGSCVCWLGQGAQVCAWRMRRRGWASSTTSTATNPGTAAAVCDSADAATATAAAALCHVCRSTGCRKLCRQQQWTTSTSRTSSARGGSRCCCWRGCGQHTWCCSCCHGCVCGAEVSTGCPGAHGGSAVPGGTAGRQLGVSLEAGRCGIRGQGWDGSTSGGCGFFPCSTRMGRFAALVAGPSSTTSNGCPAAHVRRGTVSLQWQHTAVCLQQRGLHVLRSLSLFLLLLVPGVSLCWCLLPKIHITCTCRQSAAQQPARRASLVSNGQRQPAKAAGSSSSIGQQCSQRRRRQAL